MRQESALRGGGGCSSAGGHTADTEFRKEEGGRRLPVGTGRQVWCFVATMAGKGVTRWWWSRPASVRVDMEGEWRQYSPVGGRVDRGFRRTITLRLTLDIDLEGKGSGGGHLWRW